MTIPIPENAIILNGKVYVLVDDDQPEECHRCALREQCDKGGTLLCQLIDFDGQGKRFDVLDLNASPWHTIINGEGVPTSGDMVVGVWIQGPEHYSGFCWRDQRTGEWYDQEGDVTCEPDYWINDPSATDYAYKRKF
jgi:hypothetical protein